MYEDSPWTAQLVDYHVLIKGNCKILILDSRRSVINSDNLRVSRKKIDLEVYIPNYKIRSFINSIIPIQPAEVFASMIENSQNGMEGCWTI